MQRPPAPAPRRVSPAPRRRAAALLGAALPGAALLGAALLGEAVDGLEEPRHVVVLRDVAEDGERLAHAGRRLARDEAPAHLGQMEERLSVFTWLGLG